MMLLRKVLSANSTTTSNADSWYNLTSQEITELESIDKMLLRKVLSAHSKTPLELLYLETGNVPIRFILKSRRLSFLHYLRNKTNFYKVDLYSLKARDRKGMGKGQVRDRQGMSRGWVSGR